MALYAIGDLHLSLVADKPMDIFGEVWRNHTEKLTEGFGILTADDVCVICGDLTWGMDIESCTEDFKFIDSLPGRKIILKGNHDYWWTTASKAKKFFEKHGISTIDILYNNCFFYGQRAICGTRGWLCDAGSTLGHDKKILDRELMRMEMSLKAAGDAEKLCFMHYPPICGTSSCDEMLRLFEKYRVELCCYGHLHGAAQRTAVTGCVDGVTYKLVAADYVNFTPVKIL